MKIFYVLVLIFGLVVFVNAQTISQYAEKSQLSGTVTDAMSAVIQNSRVIIRDKTGKIFETITNEDGVYKIELNEGNYSIEFSATGFKTFKIENYKVSFKGKMMFDVSLDVRDCSDPSIICHFIIVEPAKEKKKINKPKQEEK